MALKKTEIYLSLDAEDLLELKRAIFQAGLTVHQFIGYIAQLSALNDHRIVDLLQGAKNYKKQRTLDGKETKIDAEVMYALISDALNKKI